MSQPMALTFEERGSGPVLLLVHGFPLDSSMWIEQLKGLAKIRTVVAINLRGHGYTKLDDPDQFSMELFADDIALTLDEIGAEQVDLCGLSMGGYVVFAFLRKYPQRVRSLILIDTKAEADSDEGKAGREKTAALVREQGMQPLYESGLAEKMLAPGASDDVKEICKRIFLSVPPEVAAADALAMRDRPDSTELLSKISVPLLWIHGEQDQLMSIDGARATTAKIPGSRFVGIPNAGHMSPLENPTDTNKAITEFLNEVTPSKKKG
ncbi:MAG: alpha/beta fold hydrolase [Actinomycetota bacterium]